MKKFLLTLFVALLSFTGQAGAAVLQVDSAGKLTGAKGVSVLGKSYDVQFAEGSCYSLYNLCDDASDFVFNTEATATAASDALLALVFVGVYDQTPSLTKFIPDGFNLFGVINPFALGSGATSGRVLIVDTSQGDQEAYDYSFTSQIGSTTSSITTGGDIFAIWSPSAQGGGNSNNGNSVPEPATYTLVMLGLGLSWRFKRQARR